MFRGLKSNGTYLKAAALAGVSTLVMATSMPAMAQSASGRAAVGAPEEIIVTARKRQESIMKAPVIVQAISAKTIENMNINQVQAITSVAPGTFINYGYAQTGITAYIRGIGNSGSATFSDQSVALNVDGYTTSRGAFFRTGIFDAAQIEVLKGPQSLFYGKSTSAGMIAITSADPTDEWETQLKVGYEFNADEISLNGYISGPITDKLGVRIAGYHSESKGYLTNPNPANSQRRIPAETTDGARLTLKYDDSDIGLRAKLKLSYGKTSLKNAQFEFNQALCATSLSYLPDDNCKLDTITKGIPDGKPYDPTADFRIGVGTGFANATPHPLFKDGKSYGYTESALGVLNLEYDISEGLTVTSVTGWSWLKAVDAGRNLTGVGITDIAADPKFHEFSQEVRLSSDWDDSWINFMIGGLINPEWRHDQLFINVPGSRFYSNGISRYKSTTSGAFAQLLLTPVDQFELSAGVRYTHSKKEWLSVRTYTNATTFSSNVDVIPLLPKSVTQNKEDAWTPEVTLSYFPTDEVTTFITYKHGYKAPGSNSSITVVPLTAANFPLRDPFINGEKVKGIEGGIKARMFDDQLNVKLTGYRYNYDNIQVSFYLAALNTAIIQNGANARVQGFELEADYTPESVPGLTINAFMNYNDTHYRTFQGAPCYQAQPNVVGQCGYVDINTGATVIGLGQDLSGKTQYFAPKFVGRLGASYNWDLNDEYMASIDGQVQYTSSYYASPDLSPTGKQDGYAVFNAALHVGRIDNAWDVALICRNCFDKRYAVNGIDGGSTAAGLVATDVQIGRPQQILLQLTVKPDIL